MANTSLHAAKDAKNDEFYTRLEDINEEMNHYEDKFRGKVVFCNCDNPKWSNFWKYFHLNFEYLGLKKLISTHYDKVEPTYKMVYEGGNDNDIEVGVKTSLEGNGDFRNQECLDLLDESDIVVTNPPFSLFREYVTVLMKHKKKFLIIGNMNAITYKEIFPLIRDERLWLGVSLSGSKCSFIVPDSYDGKNTYYENGHKMAKINNAIWFTNLDHTKRHETFETSYLYSKKDSLYPDLYPKYDNYDAIHIDKMNEIPMDYDGIMGVPITFMGKLNPVQFELVGLFNHGCDGPWDYAKPIVNGKERFKRIAIRKKAGANNG